MIKPSDIVFVIKQRGNASLFMARYARLKQEKRIGTEIHTPHGIMSNIITDYESFKKAVNQLWDQHLIDARSRDSVFYGETAKAIQRLFELCAQSKEILKYIQS